MTEHTLRITAIALEQSFFPDTDPQVPATALEKAGADADDVTALTAGIVNWKVWDELQRMEITPKTLMAFSLFPAIHVAWANGRVEAAEKDALLQAAEIAGSSSSSSAGLAQPGSAG